MLLKLLQVIIWAFFILIATSNSSFQSLIFKQDIEFSLNLFPNFLDIFMISDIHLNSKTYVIQKIGHVFCFAILYLLIQRIILNRNKTLIICTLFALFTEFLQLYFERSGRLIDVLIDFIGIYIAYKYSILLKKWIEI